MTGDHQVASGCFLCDLAAPHNSALVVGVTEHASIMCNRYPYNSGHLLVSPLVHTPTLDSLDADLVGPLFEMVRTATALLEETYHPHGFNIGINQGSVAGGSVVDHLHVHVLPRWEGDTNFLPTIGDAKVLPEALEVTAQRLQTAFEATRTTL